MRTLKILPFSLFFLVGCFPSMDLPQIPDDANGVPTGSTSSAQSWLSSFSVPQFSGGSNELVDIASLFGRTYAVGKHFNSNSSGSPLDGYICVNVSRNGILDTTFNPGPYGGTACYYRSDASFAGGTGTNRKDIPNAIVGDPATGRIYIAFESVLPSGLPRIGVLAFLQNGQLDTSFGNSGVVVFTDKVYQNGNYSEWLLGKNTISLGANGEIFLAGVSGGGWMQFIVGLLPNGSLNPAFHTVWIPGGVGGSMALGQDSSGPWLELASGMSGPARWEVRRYDLTGEPVFSFGNQGVASVSPPTMGNFTVYSLVLAVRVSDGSSYVLGTLYNPTLPGFSVAVIRFNSTGAVDVGFGNNFMGVPGLLSLSDLVASDQNTDLGFDASGGMILAGVQTTRQDTHNTQYTIVRRYSVVSGQLPVLDSSFGNGGTFSLNDTIYPGLTSAPAAMAITGNYVIVGGYYIQSRTLSFLLQLSTEGLCLDTRQAQEVFSRMNPTRFTTDPGTQTEQVIDGDL
jgi:hypothetical protein